MKKNVMTGSLATLLVAAALPMTALAARGEWIQLATDQWKQSGNNGFYLDENGVMATNSLIETDDDYYYVDGGGARIMNEWRQAMDEDGEVCWYYFGHNGKARKASSSGNVSTVEIGGKKYAFDSEGRMLYGWVRGDSPELADEDAWADADYYFGDPEDGAAAVGWKQPDVVDDGDDCTYWFYFGTNAKKNRSAKKTLDGKQYIFDTEDGHMLTGWAAATSSNAAQAINPDSSVKYIRNDGFAEKNSWVWAVPDEDYIKEDYDVDEYGWWYTNGSGKVYTDEVKKIRNKRYALDKFGRMLTGFVTVDADRHNIQSVGNADEISEAKLYDNRFPILYFCTDKDGRVTYVEYDKAK